MSADTTHTEFSYFLLIYRVRSSASTFVAKANSLADALDQAEAAGLKDPNSFRLGQQLDADLDDRFHESCHKRGIHLGFRTPI